MPRNLTSGMASALSSQVIRPAILADITFATSVVYVWSGYGTLTWNGRDYLGVGSLGTISNISEGSTVEARGVTLNLSGVDNSLLADCMADHKHGLLATLYLALFNADGSMISSPCVLWLGRVDQPSISIGADKSTISLALEGNLMDVQSSAGRRLTSEDLQMQYPGDLGLSFVNLIQFCTSWWGTKPTSSGIIN